LNEHRADHRSGRKIKRLPRFLGGFCECLRFATLCGPCCQIENPQPEWTGRQHTLPYPAILQAEDRAPDLMAAHDLGQAALKYRDMNRRMELQNNWLIIER